MAEIKVIFVQWSLNLQTEKTFGKLKMSYTELSRTVYYKKEKKPFKNSAFILG